MQSHEPAALPKLIPAFAKLEPILTQNKLATPGIYQLLNETKLDNEKDEDMIQSITDIFSILIKHGVVTLQDYEIFLQKKGYFGYIQFGLSEMSQANVPDLVVKYRLIVKHYEFAMDIGLAFARAHKKGLLNEELYALIIEHPERSDKLVDALGTLKNATLLSIPNRADLIQKMKETNYSIDIGLLIDQLYIKKILTQKNFTAVMRNAAFAEEMYETLFNMEHRLTPEDYQQTFDKTVKGLEARMEQKSSTATVSVAAAIAQPAPITAVVAAQPAPVEPPASAAVAAQPARVEPPASAAVAAQPAPVEPPASAAVAAQPAPVEPPASAAVAAQPAPVEPPAQDDPIILACENCITYTQKSLQLIEDLAISVLGKDEYKKFQQQQYNPLVFGLPQYTTPPVADPTKAGPALKSKI